MDVAALSITLCCILLNAKCFQIFLKSRVSSLHIPVIRVSLNVTRGLDVQSQLTKGGLQIFMDKIKIYFLKG